MGNFNTKRHWNKHRVMRDGEKKESAVIKRKMCLFIQSCLTLCDPMLGKPPSSSVPGDSPTRILECVAMPSSRVSSQPKDQICVFYGCLLWWFLYHYHHLASMLSHSVVSDSWPLRLACQAPLPMRFSRQEYWSGLPFPSPGDLPEPGIKPGSPALQVDSYRLSYEGSPSTTLEAPKEMVVTAPF